MHPPDLYPQAEGCSECPSRSNDNASNLVFLSRRCSWINSQSFTKLSILDFTITTCSTMRILDVAIWSLIFLARWQSRSFFSDVNHVISFSCSTLCNTTALQKIINDPTSPSCNEYKARKQSRLLLPLAYQEGLAHRKCNPSHHNPNRTRRLSHQRSEQLHQLR